MGGKPKKLLEQIHPLHIIKEVQKWPALYVKDTSERPNTHFKKKLWCEVAKALFPEWETYTKEEMENKGKLTSYTPTKYLRTTVCHLTICAVYFGLCHPF